MSIELYQGVLDLFVDDDGETQLMVDGIPFGSLAHTCIYQMLNPGLEFPATRNRVARILKRHGVDWQVRFLYGRLLGGKKSNDQSKDGRGFTLFTIYNQAVINSLFPVYLELLKSDKKPIAVFSDPGIRSVLPDSISGLCYSANYGVGDEARVSKEWRQVKANLDAYSTTLKKRLQALPDSASVDADKVVSFLYPFLKQCLRDARAIKNLIGRCAPEYVVMGSDSTKLGRLFSIIARQRGIRSVVIQHGATVDPYGYVPVYADIAAIWGRTSESWYRQHGVAESQLVITGNPQFGGVRLQASKPVHSDTKVILATNPLAKQLNEKLVEIAIEVANNRHLALKLRPHPSEDPTFYRRFTDSEGSQLELCTGSLDELIRPGDIVVTCNSTIGIDALIRGAFLIVVSIPGVGSPIPYAQYGAAETVALSAKELDRVIARFASGAAQRDEEKTQAFLHDYLGALDGCAATRIAGILTH